MRHRQHQRADARDERPGIRARTVAEPRVRPLALLRTDRRRHLRFPRRLHDRGHHRTQVVPVRIKQRLRVDRAIVLSGHADRPSCGPGDLTHHQLAMTACPSALLQKTQYTTARRLHRMLTTGGTRSRLRAGLEMSERQACTILCADRSTLRYPAKRPDDAALHARGYGSAMRHDKLALCLASHETLPDAAFAASSPILRRVWAPRGERPATTGSSGSTSPPSSRRRPARASATFRPASTRRSSRTPSRCSPARPAQAATGSSSSSSTAPAGTPSRSPSPTRRSSVLRR